MCGDGRCAEADTHTEQVVQMAWHMARHSPGSGVLQVYLPEPQSAKEEVLHSVITGCLEAKPEVRMTALLVQELLNPIVFQQTQQN